MDEKHTDDNGIVSFSFGQSLPDDYYDLSLYDPDRKIRVGRAICTGPLDDCKFQMESMDDVHELVAVRAAKLDIIAIHCNTGRIVRL